MQANLNPTVTANPALDSTHPTDGGTGVRVLLLEGIHPDAVARLKSEGYEVDSVGRALDAINEHLEEPIESLVALDRHGDPCLEAKAPQDIDEALAMPGGHIFHGDLAWPWAPNRSRLDTPAHRWGVVPARLDAPQEVREIGLQGRLVVGRS